MCHRACHEKRVQKYCFFLKCANNLAKKMIMRVVFFDPLGIFPLIHYLDFCVMQQKAGLQGSASCLNAFHSYSFAKRLRRMVIIAQNAIAMSERGMRASPIGEPSLPSPICGLLPQSSSSIFARRGPLEAGWLVVVAISPTEVAPTTVTCGE